MGKVMYSTDQSPAQEARKTIGFILRFAFLVYPRGKKSKYSKIAASSSSDKICKFEMCQFFANNDFGKLRTA